MRFLLLFLFTIPAFMAVAQPSPATFTTDSLLIIEKNPGKGFYNDYILFIPKGTPLDKKLFLLVEPNNTGKISDSMEIHKQYAIGLASVSSVGNNISTELKIPLLVPVFPRPASKPLVYTHALDRDVMLENQQELQRPDLQLLQMIRDAKAVLAALNIQTHTKVFMNGFSASASFTNRFSFLHPHTIKALAIGGFNGALMLPQKKLDKIKLNYPVGTYDFTALFNKKPDMQTYRSIPQFIYMGKIDENDAVQYDDAYNEEERAIINGHIGKNVQERYVRCQKIYQLNKINPQFKTYEAVGHWTTSAINLEVITFFSHQTKEQ